ncbi:SH3 domain-containing protein [Leptospira bourretii]|nr:SH3 domain-containing protein [Leptospira bourretii]
MKKTLIITILLVSFLNCKKNQTNEIKEKSLDFPPKEMLIHANGGLRLRETPNINGNILIVIPNGSTIKTYGNVSQDETHDGKTGKWTRVKYLHYSGFVFSGFLAEKLDPKDFQTDIDILNQIENTLGFKINSKYQISLDSRNKNKYVKNLEIVKDLHYKEFRAVSITPQTNGCEFYGDSNCYNLIFKNDSLIFHDINSNSIGMLQDIKDEKFIFLIEAGCGAGCDYSYNSTSYEFNTKSEKFFRIENYTSITECVEEIDMFTEDCIKCSKDFKYSNYSKIITQEIDLNRTVIKTDIKEILDKK